MRNLCLRLAPLADFGVPGALKLRMEVTRVVWAESADGGHTFRFRDLFPNDTSTIRHGFNLERSTGQHEVAAGRTPAALYYTGLNRYPAQGEVIHNSLFCLME